MREVGVQAGAQGAHLPMRGSHHPHLHSGSPSAQTAPPSTLTSTGRLSAAVSHGTRWELMCGSDSPALSGAGLRGPNLCHRSARTHGVPQGTWGFHCGRNSPPGE